MHFQLTSQHSVNKDMEQVEQLLEVSIDEKKLIEEVRAGALKEWYGLRNNAEMTNPEVRRALIFIQNFEDERPNVCKIIEISLVTQTSNAQAERVFTDLFVTEM